MSEIKVFKSKRNRVALVERAGAAVVEKTFADPADGDREAAIYALLQETRLKTPVLIKYDAGVLTLSYLRGRSMLEVLEKQERSASADFSAWEKLADWLLDFNKASGLIMPDVNLRNFLIEDESGETAGLDFEECRKGDVNEMAARLCAFVLLYDPAYTAVKLCIAQRLQAYFAQRLVCGAEHLRRLTEREIKIIRDRRRARNGQ